MNHNQSGLFLSNKIVKEPLSSTHNLQYWPMVLLIFPLFTVFGNVLVVLSVIRETNLHAATNYFIVSLAVADISLAIFVMPLASWVEANNGQWHYGTTLCDIFIMFDVLLCTASILNLAAISMDRYVAVTKPIYYAQHSKNIRVGITIASTWLLSFLIALPIVCGLNNVPYRNLKLCIMYTPDYIIASSIGSFYIPCSIMIILYYQIFKAIRARSKRSINHGKHHSAKQYLKAPNSDILKPNTTSLFQNKNDNEEEQYIVVMNETTLKSDLNLQVEGLKVSNKQSHYLPNSNILSNYSSSLSGENSHSYLINENDNNNNNNNNNNTKETSNVSNYNHNLEDNVNSTIVNNNIEHNNTKNDTTCYNYDLNLTLENALATNQTQMNDTNSVLSIQTKSGSDDPQHKFKNMDNFRKHLRQRIQNAKRSSLSLLTPAFCGLTGKQMYALNVEQCKDSGQTRLFATPSIFRRISNKKTNNTDITAGVSNFRGKKYFFHKHKHNKLKHTQIDSGHCIISGNSTHFKDNLAARREKKATKTLAIVLGNVLHR